jgi:hypothetical protein
VTLRLKWWSLRNWLSGYKFDPIQRFRCCDHTISYHYRGCRNHALHALLREGQDERS